MPEFDFSGSFVNEDNCANNSVLTIISHPVPQEKESADMVLVDGVLKKKKYMVLNMEVEFDGKRKTYTPDVNTGRRFNAVFGKDFSTWVGRQFKVKIEDYKAFGADKKRIAGYPIEA